MEPEEFQAYLVEKAGLVDAKLEAYLATAGAIPRLHDGVLYALGLDPEGSKHRGKRLRPVLCLLTCESLGGEVEKALPFAAACEMLHNFFLVHDDIEDRDVVRHDRETVWVRFGEEDGINIGDYMMAQTYDLVLRSGDVGVDPLRVLELVDVITRTLQRTGEGQALDMGSRGRRDMSIDDYMEVVTLKTGFYLAAPLVGGAIVADAPAGVKETLMALGGKIGPIFQIADDVIDLTHGKGRGERGSDIKEGKRSILAVHTASQCTTEEREELFRILDKPRPETTPEEVRWAIALFEKHDAAGRAKEMGHRLMEEAKWLLKKLPSPLDANLSAAAEFMLERRF